MEPELIRIRPHREIRPTRATDPHVGADVIKRSFLTLTPQPLFSFSPAKVKFDTEHLTFYRDGDVSPRRYLQNIGSTVFTTQNEGVRIIEAPPISGFSARWTLIRLLFAYPVAFILSSDLHGR